MKHLVSLILGGLFVLIGALLVLGPYLFHAIRLQVTDMVGAVLMGFGALLFVPTDAKIALSALRSVLPWNGHTSSFSTGPADDARPPTSGHE